MNKLIFTAHPSSSGFTHKIADSYKQGSENSGDSVEIIDLYDKQYMQDYLAFEHISDIPEDEIRNLLHEKIIWADELVFVFPVWWGHLPGIMKNFFDMNFTSGFAFRFNSLGGAEGLLRGKTARIFCTCDAPGFIYRFFIFPMRLKGYFKMYLLGFCGVEVKSFKLYDTMKKQTDEKKNKILDEVYNMGNL